jgi:hypothetical protein
LRYCNNLKLKKMASASSGGSRKGSVKSKKGKMYSKNSPQARAIRAARKR